MGDCFPRKTKRGGALRSKSDIYSLIGTIRTVYSVYGHIHQMTHVTLSGQEDYMGGTDTGYYIDWLVTLLVGWFIRSFIHSFVGLFVHSFNCSFVHMFVSSFLPSFLCSLVRSLVGWLVCSFAHSLVGWLVCSFVSSLVGWLSHFKK